MICLDGKSLSLTIRKEISEIISNNKLTPKLVILQINDDESSKIYLKKKKEECKRLGIKVEIIKITTDTSEEKIINKIRKLNSDENINGIIIQLPIDKKYSKEKIIDTIALEKDIDGLRKNSNYLPSTVCGIIKILKEYKINIDGKNIVIINRSELIGKPLFNYFINNNATVTMCHSKTKDISLYTKTADIIVSAVGKKDFLTYDMIKKNSVIIDCGINKTDEKVYGDVNYESVKDKEIFLTPVPGGVGPMTVISLMKNLIEATINQRKERCYEKNTTNYRGN